MDVRVSRMIRSEMLEVVVDSCPDLLKRKSCKNFPVAINLDQGVVPTCLDFFATNGSVLGRVVVVETSGERQVASFRSFALIGDWTFEYISLKMDTHHSKL